LERTFYTSYTRTFLNLTQIERWIWEEKLFEIKLQRLCHGNPSMNSTTNTLYFRQAKLPYNNSNDAENWGKPSTPFKQELFQVWHKSNGGFGRNNYLK
jgi:hypothetical protein